MCVHIDGIHPIQAQHGPSSHACKHAFLQRFDLRLLLPLHSPIVQLECFDLPSPSPNIVAPRPAGVRHGSAASPSSSSTTSLPACCPESVIGSGSRITLLGCGGTLYCSRLMSWQERLSTLQQLGKWGLGLWLGLEFYGAQLRRARPPSPAVAAAGSGSSMGGSAERQQQLGLLQQWLLGLLLGYVSAALAPGKSSTGSSPAAVATATAANANAAAAALVAVDLCLLLPGSLPTALFQRIFPMFQV